ncbi:unnamed protein product [Calypogeia fissa]
METRAVHSVQLRPSLSQVGSSHSKTLDQVGWSVSMAGGFSGSCLTSSQPISGSHCPPTKPLFIVKGMHRMQTEQLIDDTMRWNISTFMDGRDKGSSRLKRSRSHEQRAAASRKIKVRSFVDQATAHSADMEVSNSSSISERGYEETGGPNFEQGDEFRKPDDEADQEQQSLLGVDDDRVLDKNSYGEEDQRHEEDGESSPGVQLMKVDSSNPADLEYNYEDMRLGEKKNWSMEEMEKLDRLRNYEYRHGSEKGVLVVQAMRVEHMKATEELLVDSFAELMGGLLTYRPLLALTVRQYVRDRYACLPDVVTLVGLYAPAEDNVVMGRTVDQFSGHWLVAGTVEVSFSNAGHPDIPSGPSPPPGSPYLCNMAVTSTYRRRGLGRQLLKAAEEVALMMGAQDLYLHCRMVDLAPLNMYQSAGYQIVATDSILSLLTLQRRRYLMRKRLPGLSLKQ